MDIAQRPRRKTAPRPSTHHAESSHTDEAQTQVGDHAGRVKRTRSKKAGKGRGKQSSKESGVVPQETVVAGRKKGTTRKRKRGDPTREGSPPKRRRGSPDVSNLQTIGDNGEDDESDLTPISSDDDDDISQQRSGLDFPFPFRSSNSSTSSESGGSEHNHRNLAGVKLGIFPEISDLDEDSDNLPDLGVVLSQGSKVAVATDKSRATANHQKDKHHHRKSDTLVSFRSSPTLPPSTLASSSHGIPTDDDMTEIALEDLNLSLPNLEEFDDVDDDSQTYQDELCLAKAKSSATVYWPAKVLGVRNLDGKRGAKHRKMFRVMFLDKKEKEIPREWFYTSWQDEFCTCKIGEFESSHIEVINDIDEESITADITSSTPYIHSSPSPSPEPISLPPLSYQAFCNLSLHQQFAYVKPVLKAIMNEQYPAGRRRHELFVKGGGSRSRLGKEGGMRGSLDARAVDELLVLVEKWCLGGRGREGFVDDDKDKDEDDGRHQQQQSQEPSTGLASEKGVDEGVTGSSTPDALPQDKPPGPVLGTQVDGLKMQDQVQGSPDEEIIKADVATQPDSQPLLQSQSQPHTSKRPRQHGSPAYEALSPLDKVQYCIEVLLPEAIIQILLWRNGERKSMEVMRDVVEEEERLHRAGEALLKRTDWVMDVMRLRGQLRQRFEEKRGRGRASAKREQKGLRRTRSGRVGNVVGSYRE